MTKEDIQRVSTANFTVCYRKKLTKGKQKKLIPKALVAHELTERTYGKEKWWMLIVNKGEA